MIDRLLDRPVGVMMVSVVIIVLGIVSIGRLPVSLIPDVDVPYITVQASAPNLSAREVDETVVKPLRQQLMQLHALEDIVCESKDGIGTIRLSFREGADIDYIFIEANEKVDRTMGQLRNIERPKVMKSDASDIPAFYINMTLKGQETFPENSDTALFPVTADFSRMSRFALEVVSKRIEQLKEVAMVDMSGYVKNELLIIPDMEKLRQAGISESAFENYVKAANVRLGSLSIRDGEYRYNVKFQSFASDKKDIEDIYINHQGRLIQVKDIARVVSHPARRSGLVRSDGKDAVTMAVIKQSDARMSDLKKQTDRMLGQFSRDYPELEFSITRDQTALLEYSIGNLVQNIVVGVLLACLIVFLFMKDVRSSSLVVLTIPTALIFSMLVFRAAGLTINIISLSGLILGVGMMMDNTIILIDNITARWRRGENLRSAVVLGTKEVIGPMLSSVLTTCAVFIPLVFLSGEAGTLFFDQAMAVTIVLLTSYAVTVVLIPVCYWVWYRRSGAAEYRPSRLSLRLPSFGFADFYESGMVWLLRHRWVGWAFFAVSSVLVVFCFMYMPKEKLPEITYTDTLLRIDWNESLTLENNSARIREIEEVAGENAVRITSMVGAQQFILRHSGDIPVSGAAVYLDCGDAGRLEKMKVDISEYLSDRYPESVYGFEVSGNIFDMVFSRREADLVARLRPVSRPELDVRLVSEVRDGIAGELPWLYVPEVQVKKDILYVADPQKMALYGVSYSELLSVLKNALNSNSLFSIVQGNETLPVVMGTDTRRLEDILGMATLLKDGYEIPAGVFMRQTYVEDLKEIFSGPEGNFYPVDLEIGKDAPGEIMGRIVDSVRRDGNFEVSFTGSLFADRAMTREMLLVLLVSLVLLYLILAAQFESLIQPFIIMSEIVMDISAALLVLWAAGVSINLMSLIGLVVVSGIVINDSILKIDTINRLRREGFMLKHAVLEAGKRRLKAIIMTSLTTILSVCPFLARGSMGDDLQYPMSLVIIAGMTVGTIVSLYFVPVVYYGIYKGKEKGRHE